LIILLYLGVWGAIFLWVISSLLIHSAIYLLLYSPPLLVWRVLICLLYLLKISYSQFIRVFTISFFYLRNLIYVTLVALSISIIRYLTPLNNPAGNSLHKFKCIYSNDSTVWYVVTLEIGFLCIFSLMHISQVDSCLLAKLSILVAKLYHCWSLLCLVCPKQWC
jgi:hypothetical protein